MLKLVPLIALVSLAANTKLLLVIAAVPSWTPRFGAK